MQWIHLMLMFLGSNTNNSLFVFIFNHNHNHNRNFNLKIIVVLRLADSRCKRSKPSCCFLWGGCHPSASFCAFLIAGSRRAFLCVDWPRRLCLFVKYTRCESLLRVGVCKAFLFVFLLFFLLFSRQLKITLDSEKAMLKEEQIIPSVWGGINVLNIFKEANAFLIIVHLSCELILCPVLRSPSPGWIKTRLYSIFSSYGYFFYMPRCLILPSRCTEPALSLSSVKEPYC